MPVFTATISGLRFCKKRLINIGFYPCQPKETGSPEIKWLRLKYTLRISPAMSEPTDNWQQQAVFRIKKQRGLSAKWYLQSVRMKYLTKLTRKEVILYILKIFRQSFSLAEYRGGYIQYLQIDSKQCFIKTSIIMKPKNQILIIIVLFAALAWSITLNILQGDCIDRLIQQIRDLECVQQSITTPYTEGTEYMEEVQDGEE